MPKKQHRSKPAAEWDRKLAMAGTVAAEVDITEVRLVASQVRMGRPPERGHRKTLRVRHRAGVTDDREQSLIQVKVGLLLEEAPSEDAEAAAKEAEGESPEDGLLIEATFLLAYRLAHLERFSEEQVQAFADVNAIYNAWPFWREYVYSTLARMALPPITLPVYRIGQDG